MPDTTETPGLKAMARAANGKGQALTYDFFIAMGVFFVILIVVFGYWSFTNQQTTDIQQKNQASTLLFSASGIWFKDGYPLGWNRTNVIELGLTNGGVINQTKINQLATLGYSNVTTLLNLGTLNIRYVLYNVTNDVIFMFPAVQDPRMASSSNIYSIDRVGILNESAVRVNTVLWE